MPLIVQYPAVVPVRIDGVVAGETNRVIALLAGPHRVQVEDADGTEPEWCDLVVDAADYSGTAVEPTFISFSPRKRSIDRYSPLYCYYNGFIFGQFMALSFADYARAGYPARQARMQEFLDEIGGEVTLPDQSVAFGSEEHTRSIGQMVAALAARSQALSDFALLGIQLIVYGNMVANGDAADEADDIAIDIERLRARYRLPPIHLENFVPRVLPDGARRIDDVLSPSLAYLASAVEGLAVEEDTAFVIMPFAPPYAGYFASFYRPALEATGLRAFRAWGGLSNEDYCDLLLKLIAKCGLVWADISDGNPNVFYETGAAHALGKVAMLIVHEDQADRLPANIGHDVVVKYAPTRANWEPGAVTQMSMIVAALRAGAFRGQRTRIDAANLDATLDESAERLLRMIIPPEAREAAKQGYELFAAKDHHAAAAAFSRAITLGLNDSDTFASRAIARMSEDDFAGAADDLSQAIERGHVQPEAIYRLRGVARNQVDDNEGAEADFSLVLARGPADAEAWFFRGVARTSLGKYDAAEADFAEAAARGHDVVQLYERRTYANVRLGRLGFAQLALERAAQAAPEAPAILARQADLHLAEGRTVEAVVAYRHALQLETSAERHFELALALLRAGADTESRHHYEQGMATATTAQVGQAIREIDYWLSGVPEARAVLDRLRDKARSTP